MPGRAGPGPEGKLHDTRTSNCRQRFFFSRVRGRLFMAVTTSGLIHSAQRSRSIYQPEHWTHEDWHARGPGGGAPPCRPRPRAQLCVRASRAAPAAATGRRQRSARGCGRARFCPRPRARGKGGGRGRARRSATGPGRLRDLHGGGTGDSVQQRRRCARCARCARHALPPSARRGTGDMLPVRGGRGG